MKVICKNCEIIFNKSSYEMKRSPNKHFCSRKCHINYHRSKSIYCSTCKIQIYRKLSTINISNNFCSRKCAAIFNNKLRRKSRRSKCEILLFNLLSTAFPQLLILANDKTLLNGLEVDIAIPELKLAIEWNGIIHFKPIYGIEKLLKIQQKDKEKLQIAAEKDINLIVISDLVSTTKLIYEQFEIIKHYIDELQQLGRGSNSEK